MLSAVDEGHRNLLAIPFCQLLVGADVHLVEALAQLFTDGSDHVPGVVAEMATGAGQKSHPVHGDPAGRE
jgi:hypothetical protein